MLSTQYRLRLEAICEKIVAQESVGLEDMIWAEKLAKANTSAREILKEQEVVLLTLIWLRVVWTIL